MAVDVELGIKVDSSGAEAGSRRVGTALREMGGNAERAQQSVFKLENALRILVTSTVVRQIIEYADTWKLLEARIKLVTQSTAEMVAVQGRLFKSAQETGTSFQSTVALYTRLARAADTLGISQSEMLQIANTISKSMQIGGATALEASGALIQLSQSFIKGKITGDEFRSIVEQTPNLLEAVAKGVQRPLVEIVRLGLAGELSMNTFIDGIKRAKASVDKDFAQVPIVVGRALTMLQNDILQFIGTVDKATGASGGLSTFIIKLGEGFRVLTADVKAGAHAMDAADAQIMIAGLRTLAKQIKETEQQLADLGKVTPTTVFEDLVFDFSKFKASLGITGETAETLEQRLTDLRKTQDELRQSLTHVNTEIVNLDLKKPAVTINVLSEATKKARESVQEELIILRQKIAILGQVEAGLISVEEAQIRMEAAVISGETKETVLARSLAEARAELEKRKSTLDDLAKAEELVAHLAAELAKVRNQEAAELEKGTRAVEAQIAAYEEEARAYGDVMSGARRYDDVLRDLEISQKEAELRTAGLGEAAHDLAVRLVDGARAAEKMREEIRDLGQDALVSKNTLINAFDQIIMGIFQGTQRIGNILISLAQGIGVKFFSQLLVGKKQNFDIPLIGNISQLFFGNKGGIIGAIFGQGGSAAAGQFVSGWQGIFNGSGAGSVFTSSGQGAAQTFFSGFTQFARSIFAKFAIPVAEGFLAAFFAKLAGGGRNAQIGAGLGAFLLGPLGGIFGGFIGSFFDHIPTKGTRIRQSVEKWLREIGVSFAAQINSNNYFFKETKALAEQMFGGDFLAASKQILTEKAGPELAKQLQALGTFLTADLAQKLGKSVEQTGTTFGNMLIANLGIDKIPEAIDEIIQKSGITFQEMMAKFIELFNANKIGADFFRDVVAGSIQIFFKNFPAAAEVARQAFDKAFKDGKISAEEFAAAIDQAMKHVQTVVGAAADAMSRGIKEGLSAEDAIKLFLDNLKEAFRNAAIEKWLKDFFGADFFKDIDLTKDILSDEDIQKMADRFKIGFENLRAFLQAAGLLPDPEVEVASWIIKLTDALQAIPESVGSALTTAIVKAWEDADFDPSKVDFSGLEAQMKDVIGRAVLEAVIGTLVQQLIVGPMMAALAPFIAGLTGGAATAGAVFTAETAAASVTFVAGAATAGAVFTAGTAAASVTFIAGAATAASIIAAGGAAAAAMLAAALRGLQMLLDLMDTPEFAAFMAQIDKWLAKKKKEIADWIPQFADALQAIPGAVGSALTTAIVKAWEDADFDPSKVDFSGLEAQMKDVIGRAVLEAVIGTLVQQLIVGPMMAALAPFIAGLTGGAATAGAVFTAGTAAASVTFVAGAATAGAVFTAGTAAASVTFVAGAATAASIIAAGGAAAGVALAAGGAAAAAMLAAALQGLQLLLDLMDTPEFQEFTKKIGGLITKIGGGFQVGSGTGGGPPGTDPGAEKQAAALQKLIEAINQFVESIQKISDPVQDLINQFKELLKLFAEAHKGIEFERFEAQLEFRRRQLANLQRALLAAQKAGDDAAVAMLLQAIAHTQSVINRLQAIVGIMDQAKAALKQGIENLVAGFETGGKTRESPLQKISDDFTALFQSIQRNANLLMKAGVNLDAILKRLTTALGKRLIEAVDELIAKFSDQDKDLASQLKDIEDEFETAIKALQKALDALVIVGKGMSPDQIIDLPLWNKILEQIKKLQDALPGILLAVAQKFLQPALDFIAKGKPEIGVIQGIFDEYDKLTASILKNADALRKAGIDVIDILTKLTDSLGKQLLKAVDDLIGKFADQDKDLASQFAAIEDEFAAAIKTLQNRLAGLLPKGQGAPISLEQALLIAELEAQIKKLLKALPGILLAVAQKFLQPALDFIAKGKPEIGAIQGIFNEYDKLRDSILKNTEALKKAGINIDDILTQLAGALIAQLKKMREELLAPVTAALEKIVSQTLPPLSAFLAQIAGARTLEKLQEIRDATIQNIEARLSKEQEAAKKATDDSIRLINEQKDAELKRLQEVQKAEEEALRSQMSMLERLISLREEQMNDEIRALEEQIKVTEDEIRARGEQLEEEKKSIEDITSAVKALREVALALRQEADALLLSAESPLTPRQRFFEAEKQFEETLARARAGDIEAAKALPGFGKSLIGEAQAVFASSEPFQDIFNRVRAAMLEVAVLNEEQANLLEGSVSLEEKSLDELKQIRKELIDQRDNLKTLFGIEDRAEEIARLTKDLGLTGKESLRALRQIKTGMEDQLAGLQDIFDQRAKEIAATFEVAIAKEQAALELRLQTLQEIAIAELETLRTALGNKFDVLVSAVMNPAWVASVLAALNNIAAKIGASSVPPPPPSPPPPPPPNLGPRVLNWPGFGSAPPSPDLLSQFDFVRFSFPGGDFSPLVKAQHGGIFTRPTTTLLAEAGMPEAAIPLPRAGIHVDNADLLSELRLLRAEVKELRLQGRGEVVVKGDVRIGEAKIGEIMAKQVEHKLSRGGINPGRKL